MKDKDLEYVEKRGAKVARAMRSTIGGHSVAPKTAAERAADAESTRTLMRGNPCRTIGCHAPARDDGWCIKHHESKRRSMAPDPPVPGLCNAIRRGKIGGHNRRCRWVLRSDETRCILHRGYSEPELL